MLNKSRPIHDFKANSTCPVDDFQDDTLRGVDMSHQTNVMFVQPDDVTARPREDHSPLQLVKTDDLKNASTRQQPSLKNHETMSACTAQGS